MTMKKTFYSNGKLLVTGEYLVLDGAKALALPTKMGQNLIIEDGEENQISWTSYDRDSSIWFEDTISFNSIIKKDVFEDAIKTSLIEILHHGYLLNPNFLNSTNGYKIKTELTFPKNWGLGTSSTLINNIAQWLEIDAFVLLKNSFDGSGYDIACAQNNSAILYQLVNEKPIVETIRFNPSYADKLYFVYLNKKQNSRTAIESYYNNRRNITKSIAVINKITQTIITINDSKTFALELQKHEEQMSIILEMQTIKEALFPDFDGVIKSLGAWGGDFVLVISEKNPIAYFKEKGFETVVTYNDMIL